MRAVVDHNVVVSAAIADGAPATVLRAAREGRFQLVASERMFEELYLVIKRPRLRRRLARQRIDPDQFIEDYMARALHVAPAAQVYAPALRDPDDTIVLATALAGEVDYIVTGDLDLLVLGAFAGIPIVTARQFLAAAGFEP